MYVSFQLLKFHEQENFVGPGGQQGNWFGSVGKLLGQCAGVHMDKNSCVKGESGDLAMYYVRGEERVLVAIFVRQERLAPEE